MRICTLALALGLAGWPLASSLAQAPVVVELFTSEACSSCPPADAFLTDLARNRGAVLPLAFHVTYWNDLGWKDPFSLDAATLRQQAYARSLGDNQVYTPEMVVDGAHGFVGSNRGEGLQAIARAAHDPAPRIRLVLTRSGAELTVAIAAGAGAGPAEVLLVGFDGQHRTQIGRGENTGRTLIESNIVRSLTPIAGWGGQAMTVRALLPAGEQFAVCCRPRTGASWERPDWKTQAPDAA